VSIIVLSPTFKEKMRACLPKFKKIDKYLKKNEWKAKPFLKK